MSEGKNSTAKPKAKRKYPVAYSFGLMTETAIRGFAGIVLLNSFDNPIVIVAGAYLVLTATATITAVFLKALK